MPRLKAGLELEALKRQQDELAKRIKDVEARHHQQKKADEERKRQIIGAAVIDYYRDDPERPFAKTLIDILKSHVRNASDRAFLDFPPLSKPKPKASEAAQTPKAAGTPAAHVKTATAPAAKPQPQTPHTAPVRNNPFAGIDPKDLKGFDEDEEP